MSASKAPDVLDADHRIRDTIRHRLHQSFQENGIYFREPEAYDDPYKGGDGEPATDPHETAADEPMEFYNNLNASAEAHRNFSAGGG